MKSLYIVILTAAAALPLMAQTRTITNDDLEKYRRERVEAEKKLNERYAEMGFPSPAERQREIDRKRAEMEEYSDQLGRQRAAAQGDIVTRANALRVQIASVNAQINYLRGAGGGVYNQGSVYAYGYVPYGGYGGYNRQPRLYLPPGIRSLPPNMRTVQEYSMMYPSSQSVYNQSTGNVRIGGGVRIGNGGSVRLGGRFDYGTRGGYRGGYVAPVIVGGSNYAANEANAQLLYLEQVRAGLLAEWRLLEEEARRAGVRID
ncbi:MAG: hypothetical protein JSS81_13500 [Acidobacteria bacterium]|nr:hypothetical protein [Acidobacteriota bacterium]